MFGRVENSTKKPALSAATDSFAHQFCSISGTLRNGSREVEKLTVGRSGCGNDRVAKHI